MRLSLLFTLLGFFHVPIFLFFQVMGIIDVSFAEFFRRLEKQVGSIMFTWTIETHPIK
jgi:hypothetical protein